MALGPEIDSSIISGVLAGTQQTYRTPKFLTVDANGLLQTNAASGGTYNTTPPTYTNGQTTTTQSDVNGNQKVTLATQIAGEDLVNNVMKVEQRFNYTYYATAQTATNFKQTAGELHMINFSAQIVGGTFTLYDNTAASGNIIYSTTIPITTQPFALAFNVAYSVGLTVNTSAAIPFTISYR